MFVHSLIIFARKQKNVEPLSSSELERSSFSLAKISQNQDFTPENSNLRSGKSLPPNSRLLKLSAFLDNDGLVTVGCRLNNSELPDVAKNHVMLSNDSHLLYLLVKNAHLRTLHGSMDLTVAHLRQFFFGF